MFQRVMADHYGANGQVTRTSTGSDSQPRCASREISRTLAGSLYTDQGFPTASMGIPTIILLQQQFTLQEMEGQINHLWPVSTDVRIPVFRLCFIVQGETIMSNRDLPKNELDTISV